MEHVVKVSTKADKTSAAKFTVLKVTLPDGQHPAVAGLAMQALIVKLQGTWRKGGIPERFECNLVDYAPGTRHAAVATPMTAQEIAAKAATDKDFRKQIFDALGLVEEELEVEELKAA